MSTDRAAMARTYVHAGWKVFPLWWAVDGRCTCPGAAECKSPGKHPVVPRGVNDASDDLDQIDTWWRRWPNANIGLPAGGNNLAVLDVDPAHGGGASLARLRGGATDAGVPLPETLTQVTGSGGAHYVFTAPDGGLKNMSEAFGPDLPGLDTRGRGGYIVAAPSIHISGSAYLWADFLAEMAPWPAILTKLMDWRADEPAPRRIGTPFTAGGAGYADAALRGEIDRVRQAGEGTRNHTLNRAAFALGQLVAAGKLDERQVRDELVHTGTSIGLSFTESCKTVDSGLRSGAQNPRRAA